MDIQNKTQIKAALRQSFAAVVYAIDELSEEEFNTPRAEDKWSPGEILGHLILSTKPVSRAMATSKEILESSFGKSNRAEKDFLGMKEKYLKGLSTGIVAPPSFTYNGAAEKGKEKLLNDFTGQLDQLLQQIDKWDEKDLTDFILPHPAIGKLTIREMLFFTHFHTQHHLNQIIPIEV